MSTQSDSVLTLDQQSSSLSHDEICRDPSNPDFKGFVIDCYREPREPSEGLWLVTQNGYILPMLDRYTIIPLEKYQDLVRRASQD
jgi:hypothetical protein